MQSFPSLEIPSTGISEAQRKALLQVARLYDMRQDWKQALGEYENLAKLYPSDPFVLEPLARTQQKLGMTKAWASTLARAMQCYEALGMPRKAELLKSKLFQIPASLAA